MINDFDDMDVKISVIVLTYNQETTIAKTLDSILEQKDAPSFEIIIGDDCSVDTTGDICQEYATKHPDIIRYFRREPNVGLNINYYKCLADCKGKYIADCAGDDYWIDPYKLRKQYDLLEGDSSISLVHAAWSSNENIESAVKLSDKPLVWQPGEAVADILAHDPGHSVHLSTSMYRKELVDKAIKKNPDLFISNSILCEDLQIIVTLAAEGKILYTPDVSLHYSINEDSISHASDFRKKINQLISNLILTKNLAEHYGVASDKLRDYYSKSLEYMGAQAYHSGKPELYDRYSHCLSIFGDIKKTKKQIIRDFFMANDILWMTARLLYSRNKSR